MVTWQTFYTLLIIRFPVKVTNLFIFFKEIQFKPILKIFVKLVRYNIKFIFIIFLLFHFKVTIINYGFSFKFKITTCNYGFKFKTKIIFINYDFLHLKKKKW